jgi:hypothetical protein
MLDWLTLMIAAAYRLGGAPVGGLEAAPGNVLVYGGAIAISMLFITALRRAISGSPRPGGYSGGRSGGGIGTIIGTIFFIFFAIFGILRILVSLATGPRSRRYY